MSDTLQPLLSSLDGDGVLTLSLNRPERLNALDIDQFDRLRDAVEAAGRDPAVRVVVLRGEGRAFSAGGDLGGMSETRDPEERTAQLRRRSEISLLLHRMPKPTVAMLRGAVAGAAISIALGCDLRIASQTTKLVPAFARVGFSGDFGISYLLPLVVGAAKAREILFFGEPILAEAAAGLGLVNRVVPDADLETTTRDLAARLAAGPGFAYALMKENLNLSEVSSFEQSLDVEARNMVRSILSDDAAEAGAAFREKREPKFRGR